MGAPLPPRARGKLETFARPEDLVASTPACAGQTTATSRSRWSSSLYPRVRGANCHTDAMTSCHIPLPPRARGKPRLKTSPPICPPSTPACAGQTTSSTKRDRTGALYPRVRGANCAWVSFLSAVAPLPPRARGKHLDDDSDPGAPASTPACAGQTAFVYSGARLFRLYPRVRGANARMSTMSSSACTLYPRVRGANVGLRARHGH